MSHALSLVRPLVVFDVETTGLDVAKDRIVELAAIKLLPDGSEATCCHRINPTVPIAPAATAVHGIHDADVAACPTFAELAPALSAFFAGADLTGFNVEKFDVPLLRHEFARVDQTFPGPDAQIVDSWQIYMRREPRDLAAALRFYCGRPLTDAHSALADARAASDILQAQLGRYEDLPREVEALAAWCHPSRPEWIDPDGKVIWREGVAVLTFGRHRGKSLAELADSEPDYLRWVAGANFSAAVAQLCRDALDGRFPQPPTDGAGETSTPSSGATAPGEGATTPTDRATAPSHGATTPSDRATAPSDGATALSDQATMPSDQATMPSDQATMPTDRATAPSDGATTSSPGTAGGIGEAGVPPASTATLASGSASKRDVGARRRGSAAPASPEPMPDLFASLRGVAPR